MSNCFKKFIFAAVGSTLSFSIININLAQATIDNYNSLSEVSPENFITTQATQTPLKIEQTTAIDGVINSQPRVMDEAIVGTKLIGKLRENNNFEFKSEYSQSQIKFVSASIEAWQNNLQKETPQPPIEPGVLFGLGLISIRALLRKKRL